MSIKKLRVVVYARVSREDKDQDPERQIMKCQQYCELHSHQVVRVLIDYHTGESSIFDRPEGGKMKGLDVDGIVVYSMDRFTREHPITVFKQLQQFRNQGIKIISITEPIFNMEGEFADLLQYIVQWFNNYYLKQLRRNVKSGIERARAKGTPIGRQKRKFNEFRAKQLLEEGKSYGEVSQDLGVPKSTIYRRFKNLSLK